MSIPMQPVYYNDEHVSVGYEQIQILSKHFLEDNTCDQLIAKYDTNFKLVNQIDNNTDLIRLVNIKIINIDEITGLKNQILSANFEHYKFNIDILRFDCFFGKYETGMHYKRLHMDCIPGNSQRKLSFSLILTNDFEGGAFELLNNSYIEQKKGKLLVFPSFLPHAITPVVSGIRYVVFGWVYGPNFV